MDIRKIKKLIELIQETGVAEIEIKEGEESVRISRQQNVVNAGQQMMQTIPVSMPQAHTESPAMSTPVSRSTTTELTGTIIRSPMVGTFYRSPSPGAPSFVEVGKVVKVGDTLAMIEAMKMFNPIEAEVAGKITAILIENNQPVEYNQPIFTIDPL